jgi:hypothetical protein
VLYKVILWGSQWPWIVDCTELHIKFSVWVNFWCYISLLVYMPQLSSFLMNGQFFSWMLAILCIMIFVHTYLAFLCVTRDFVNPLVCSPWEDLVKKFPAVYRTWRYSSIFILDPVPSQYSTVPTLLHLRSTCMLPFDLWLPRYFPFKLSYSSVFTASVFKIKFSTALY